MPAKLFDAMALGVPAISTAVSDIPEVLEGAGWVVPPNSPDALREAIRQRFRDPGEAARRAGVARQRCVERFSWDAMSAATDVSWPGNMPRKLQGPVQVMFSSTS